MINKGVERICDNKEINNFMAMSERRIPFDHMIYFGDGLTDMLAGEDTSKFNY